MGAGCEAKPVAWRGACSGADAAPAAGEEGVAHADRQPSIAAPAPDGVIEKRIDAPLAALSLEQKVGQTIQGDIGSMTPDDVATYHLGSILNGGSSSPGGNEFDPASTRVAAAEAYYGASMRPNGNSPHIPLSRLPGAKLESVTAPFGSRRARRCASPCLRSPSPL